MAQGGNGPTNLTSSHIFVGNSSNVPTDVALSGDVTIDNTGATSIALSINLPGSPTTTTQSSSDNSTKIATTAFVKSAATPIVASTTANTIPTFSNTTGKIQDTGVTIDGNNALYGEVQKVTTQTGTTYTLASTDTGTTILFNNSGNIVVTVPNNLAVGFNCNMIQMGNGQVQLIPASGATLQNSYNTPNTKQIYSEISIVCNANSGGSSGIYTVSGDVAGAAGVPTAAAASVIQSIQPFSCTIAAGSTSNTVTINAITTANAYVNYQGVTGQAATYAAETCQCYPTITNTTTITIQRSTSDASNSITYYGTVVEFKAGVIKTNNQGTIVIASAATTNTATISAVTVANTFIHWNGQNFSASTDDANYARCLGNLILTNTTTITATRTTASTSTLTLSYACIEFNTGFLAASGVQKLSFTSNSTAVAVTIATQTAPLQTMVIWGGFISNSTTPVNQTMPGKQDIGGITMAHINASDANSIYTLNLCVVEFLAGTITGKYQGNPLIAATTTSTADTIPSSSTSLSLVQFDGMFPSAANTAFNTVYGSIAQTNTTTVTATRNTSHATIGTRVPYTILTFHS